MKAPNELDFGETLVHKRRLSQFATGIILVTILTVITST